MALDFRGGRGLFVSRSNRFMKLVVLAFLALAVGQVAVMAQARFRGTKQLAKRPTFTDDQRAVFFQCSPRTWAR